MNKRHTGKLLAFLLAVVFMFTLIPQVLADGDEPQGDDISKWIYIHDTEGHWGFPLDGDILEPEWVTIPTRTIKSSIKINGQDFEVDSEGNAFFNEIPAGASVSIDIGFHINEDAVYDSMKPHDWFTFTLPDGIDFSGSLSGPITDESSGDTFANWTIENNILTVRLTEVFSTDYDGEFEFSGVWGFIQIEGTFEEIESGDEDDLVTEIVFGGQTIVINRKEPIEEPEKPTWSNLTKSYEYNPSQNKITWTVTVTPPDDDQELDYRGYVLTDILTGNHKYLSNSFKVNDIPIADSGEGLSVAANKKELTYTFPFGEGVDEIKGPQTITYETEITQIYSKENTTDKNLFKNRAELTHNGQAMAEPAESTFSLAGFFEKIGGELEKHSDGNYYIKWTVKLTIKKSTSVFTFQNGKLVDQLTDGKHAYATNRGVTIKFPGDNTARDLSNTDNGNDGYYNEVAIDGQGYLYYYFPTEHPKSQIDKDSVYELTYYTKMLDWNGDLDTNDPVTVENKAWFEWGLSGTGDGPAFQIPDYVVEKIVKPKGGLIKKEAKPSTSEAYIYGDTQYIKWEVVINGNNINMEWGTVTLTDGVISGNEFGNHSFYVDATHKFEIYINDSPDAVATFSSSAGTTGAYTLVKLTPDGFRLSFADSLGVTDVTYRVEFYTKVNDTEDSLNPANNDTSITYANDASLKVGDKETPALRATKTLTFQMLEKTSIESSFDPETRKLQYELVVNRNRSPLTGAVITDLLPEHMVLWYDGLSDPADYSPEYALHFLYQLNGQGGFESLSNLSGVSVSYPLTIEEDGVTKIENAFEISLPDTPEDQVGDQYTIRFWVYLKDDALLGPDPDPTFVNNVELELADIDDPFTSTDTTQIDYKTITKAHDYKAGNDKITWTVEINPAGVELKNAIVSDTLHKYLELVEGSVKLYLAEFDVGGNLIKADPVTLQPTEEDDPTPHETQAYLKIGKTNEGQDYFKLTLPKGSKAYILEFETDIVEESSSNNDKVTNTITLTGQENDPSGTGTTTGIVISQLYSKGGSGSRTLTITKTNGDEVEPVFLDGANFQLFTKQMTPFYYRTAVGTDVVKSSGADGVGTGQLTFNGLPNWDFYIKETAPAPGYLIPTESDGTTIRIFGPFKPSDFGPDKPIPPIVNQLALHDITIYKKSYRDDINSSTGLEGAKFTITSTDPSSEFGPVTKTSDNAGKVTFSGVPLGTYHIEETEPPLGGYKLVEGKLEVTVKYNGNKTATELEYKTPSDKDIVKDGNTYTFINRFMGKIEIIKHGESQNPLAGVGFMLLVKDEDGEGYKEFRDEDDHSRQGETDSDGKISFLALPPGEYYIQETSAPYEYILPDLEDDANLILVTIPQEGDNYEIVETLSNNLLRASIQVSKEGPGGEKLDGGLFKLTKDDDSSFVKTASAEKGVVTFEELLPGTYQIEELEAPYGYAINQENKKVTVTLEQDGSNSLPDVKAGSEASEEIINDYDGQIKITKTGSGSRPLKDVTFGLFTEDETGKKVPFKRDNEDYKLTTGDTGVVEFTGLPEGVYFVRELAAPIQYHLPSVYYRFDVEYKMDGTAQKWIHTKSIGNSLLTDGVILEKVDPDGVALDGGLFGLFSNSAATGKALMEVVAVDGRVVFNGLDPGTYYIRELEAPEGFMLTDEIVTVSVALDGRNGIYSSLSKDSLVNTWAGGIKLVKVDEKGEPLAGAVFELLDANKKVIREETSGKDGVIEFKELAMGTYYLREKTAPAGYAKLMELTEVVLKAGAEADMVKTVKLANHLNLASVTLRKTNQYDGLVSGGLFGIYKTDDDGFKNPLQKVASVKGMIIFTDLEAGQYFIREIEAPEDHKLTGEFVKVVLEVNPDTGLLEDVEIEKPLLNETPLTEEEWDEKVEGDDDEKDNGGKDDDLVETGGFLDTAMLWFFGTLLILAGAILLLRMRAALVRK